MTNQHLLDKIIEDEGFESETKLLESATFDTCYGICKSCYSTYSCEPDAVANYCEECEDNTVVSCLILAGVI